ncbi:uncharacterized protein LOC111406334 [Olea europaea var. sylvestris]|uniref:uncharacterized protein LOC111406334 n=1 Tax=Olea europaea var. sylvestris TaxID=158386 RepID=UPI000C1CEB59|nr:uncharacterized protein LOC111406334 [Olea europaea var. sylvestris]
MLVKSIKAKDHCQHLTEMFDILRKYRMKLNLRKCAFEVSSGRFLGYIVNNRGIEVNPEKIQAIIQMKPPTKPKEVQSLTGRVAALSRFVSKYTDQCKPFFDTLRGGKKFEWTKECQDAFNELKRQLARPPVLSKPKAEENGIQHPVYYVSKALHEAELRYSAVEKLTFTLLMAARKLRSYFLEHPIEVLTNSPLRQTLQKFDTFGRMKETPWKLYIDGSSTKERSGADVVLISPDHRMFCEALPFDFKASNNEAEYEALIAGARMASGLGISDLILHSDSQLVVNQANGVYMAKKDRMDNYLHVVKKELERFKTTQVKQIPRSQNNHADALARLATSEGIEEFDSIPVGRISLPSIELDKVVLMMIDPKPTWQEEIISYLKTGKYPENPAEARKLRTRLARYTLIDNILYKRGYSMALLRCLNEEEAQYALQDVHEGICGNHSGGLSLAHKIVRQGYFWPAIRQDSLEFVKRCDKCQRLAPIINTPPRELNPVTVPWPFSKWGVDLIGPMPVGKGGVKFAIIAVDYFTKWAEVEPFATITEQKTTHFLWKSVICRFGIPHSIVTDNGKQFDNARLSNFCKELDINKHFSSPNHPQANGQVEAINKIIKHTLKAKLDLLKGGWAEELPSVLWSYRTTARTSTGETPFSMAFGIRP